jgi:putative ABC transport system permease protein
VASFLQDFRYSLRQLSTHPGFALAAILSLALGIGATVSVFSVIYGVLLHPFPYANVDRLANLSLRDAQGRLFDAWFSAPQLRELRKMRACESIATWNSSNLTVTGRDLPEDVVAFFGIGETFPTLGVPALLGRNLGPSDSPDGQEPQPVVMLHYRFWQRHFNGDLNIIGKALELSHKNYTIVGVTSANFTWGWGADVYLPQEISHDAGGGVVVKLRPGIGLTAADAELQLLLERFAEQRPHTFPERFKVDIRPLTFEVRRNMGGTLYLLLAAVGTLLAIGCSNVSILLLARGTARQHEFAVRSAVGASGIRIVRQLLTESLMLALTGMGLGILLAYRLVGVIAAWMPSGLYPPDVLVRVNFPVLLFSAALALFTVVLFGLIPALQMAKPDIKQFMQSGAKRAAGSVRGKHLHGALVAAQIALTLLLLTAAGSAITGFMRLMRVPLGYDPTNVLSVRIPLQENTLTTWESRANYFEQLRANIAGLPGVVSAGLSSSATPPISGWEQRFDLLGKPTASPELQTARISSADPAYFGILRMPLLQGRIWSPTEVTRGATLVIVNQSFAKRYCPQGDIVGHSLRVPTLISKPPDSLTAPGADGWMEVIGVVTDALNDGLDKPIKPAIFVPYSTLMLMGTQVLVRTRVAPESIVQSIRKELASVNPDQQISSRIEDLETRIKRRPEWARGRLIAALFAGFSILALVLSAVGLYSVVSYSVAQRTNEFGIRIALGARRSQVLKVAMASAGISVACGIVAGLVLGVGTNRIVSVWVGNTGGHPLIVFGASFLLLLVAAIACLMPVRRALSVDPMTALRCE